MASGSQSTSRLKDGVVMLHNSYSRREAMVVGAATLLAGRCSWGQTDQSPAQIPMNRLCVFTKPFNSLSFDELADRIAELGVQGIEAPIRPGGHIEPQAVADELPQLVEALRKRNLEITVLTSDINDPRDPLARAVLGVAAGLGIQRYRMKYFHYDLRRPILEQHAEWRPMLRELAAFNRELGIKAVYQNHAGNRQMGAALWDLAELLRDISVDEIGVAYDIRHAAIEGGLSWPITFHRIRPHIDTVYVKDAVWENRRPKNVPLGTGIVSEKFFEMLRQSEFNGPISLHEEYLDHRQPELVLQHLHAIERDLATLRKWLG